MSQTVEDRFIEIVRQQLKGLSKKVENEFSQKNYEKELLELTEDPVFSKFSFNTAEYVLIRFMGRISISIGRRLGHIYEKVPRYAAAARFHLSPKDIAPKFNKLELDVGLDFSKITSQDISRIKKLYKKYFDDREHKKGIGIEIRYRFSPNDNARITKDVNMGKYLANAGLTPVYLIFSSDIKRFKDAIPRLRKSGWSFLAGEKAIEFINELLLLDIQSLLDEPAIKDEIKKVIDEILKNLVSSHAFNQVLDKYKQ